MESLVVSWFITVMETWGACGIPEGNHAGWQISEWPSGIFGDVWRRQGGCICIGELQQRGAGICIWHHPAELPCRKQRFYDGGGTAGEYLTGHEEIGICGTEFYPGGQQGCTGSWHLSFGDFRYRYGYPWLAFYYLTDNLNWRKNVCWLVFQIILCIYRKGLN